MINCALVKARKILGAPMLSGAVCFTAGEEESEESDEKWCLKPVCVSCGLKVVAAVTLMPAWECRWMLNVFVEYSCL